VRSPLVVAPLIGLIAGSFLLGGPPPSAAVATAEPVDGPLVSVMLELDATPAAVAYRSLTGVSTRAAETASVRATRVVERMQSSVTRSATALGATELFRVSAVYAGVAVQVPVSRLDDLEQIPGVTGVSVLGDYEPANWASVPLMRAPEVWESAGLTGKGVTIGVIDTGIDYTHAGFGGPGTVAAYQAALAAKDRGEAADYPDTRKVAGGYDFVGNAYDSRDPANSVPQPDANPLDCAYPSYSGHGTHVAGSAAGYGVTAEGSTYRGPWKADLPWADFGIGPGVAPEAALYALKVFGCKGSTNVVIAAIDWAMDPNQDGDVSDHLDVVNMSLGSAFGNEEDPVTVATQNAALAGMIMVVSAGNSGPQYLSNGSPSIAPAAISVASHISNGVVIDAFRLTIDGKESTAVGSQTTFYTADRPGETTAPVRRIGEWTLPPSADNNSDACSPLTPEQREQTKDHFLAVVVPAKPRCNDRTSMANAQEAGAVGVLLARSAPTPAEITPLRAVLGFSMIGETTKALDRALDAGQRVQATLGSYGLDAGRYTYTGAQSRSSRVSPFSAMGAPYVGTVKPDVAAPGQSIYSAASGSGSGGYATVGTSMAAPHVAGEVALVLERHPTWTPTEVKSAIVNSVDADIYAQDDRQGPRVDPLRVGTGRADVMRAIAADTLVSLPAHPGSTSVGFGILDVATPLVRSQQVLVTDVRTRGDTRIFTVRLDDVNALPGATYSAKPDRITLRPGGSARVTVTLRVDPARLTHRPDPTLALTDSGSPTLRDFLAPSSALLRLRAADGTAVRVAVASAPRPTSQLTVGASVRVAGDGDRLAGTLVLRGTGVDNRAANPMERIRSMVSAVHLLGSSPRTTTGAESGADLRYVGASSDALMHPGTALSVDDSSMAYIGIATWGPWLTPYEPGHFTVFLDTDRDGTADAKVSSTGPSQFMRSSLYSLRAGDRATRMINAVPLNALDGRADTGKFRGNVVVLPIRLAALADPSSFARGTSPQPFITADDARVHFWVTSMWGTTSGDLEIDSIGSAQRPLVIDLLNPAVSAFGSDASPLPSRAMPGDTLAVSVATEAMTEDPQLLVMHHLNPLARRAEVVPIRLNP
jgi:subtilisin family serine protease